MPSVADCLRQHQEAFLRQSADQLTLQQRKVLSAVTRCRTGQLGHVIFECQSCGHPHWVGRSCGNRHCPTCQHQKSQQWLQKQTERLLPVQHFLVYRQKFREALRAAGLETNADPSVWHRWWEVSVKPVGDGKAVLKYLAPNVYRVAISDNRIVDCTEQGVTYRWTPSGTKKVRTRTVTGQQFVGAFLQHVLPKGFRKVRHYGWMASNSRTTRDRVKWLVWLWLGWIYWLASGVAPQPERVQQRIPECTRCGGALRLLAITDPTGRVVAGSLGVPPPVLAGHATEYLDSG